MVNGEHLFISWSVAEFHARLLLVIVMNIIGIRQKLTSKTNAHKIKIGESRLVKIMPNSNSVPRKEGELLKYRNVWHGWGKRYFKLERTYLHYFETKHEHSPLQTITRGEIAQVKTSAAFPEKPNVFEIVLKSGTIWYCQASSSGEMIEWMQSLSTVPITVDASHMEERPAEPFECIHPVMTNPVNPAYNPTYPNPEEGCSVRNTTPSPYKDVHNDAHEVAHVHGYHGHTHKKENFPNTPPPPYSEHDNNRPQFPTHYPKWAYQPLQ